MDIKISTTSSNYGIKNGGKDPVNKATTRQAGPAKETEVQEKEKDQYIPSNPEKDIVYEKNVNKPSVKDIDQLIKESNKAYEQLRDMVQRLLGRQGLSYKDLNGQGIEIDNETRLEAQAAIGDGGDQSPEKVSDRIVDFAIALSGGDKSKLETLVAAIDKGFSEAARILGGSLPDISNKTYDLIMEKLDRWSEE